MDPHEQRHREGRHDAEEGVEIVDELTIVNEFGVARIRKLRARNGERLEIHSPRFGYTLRLDAILLEALSWQSQDTISEFLETPVGPDLLPDDR